MMPKERDHKNFGQPVTRFPTEPIRHFWWLNSNLFYNHLWVAALLTPDRFCQSHLLRWRWRERDTVSIYIPIDIPMSSH